MLIPSSIFRALAEGRAGDHRRGLLQLPNSHALAAFAMVRLHVMGSRSLMAFGGIAAVVIGGVLLEGAGAVFVSVIDTAATASLWRSAITSELTQRIDVLEQRPAQAKWRRRGQPRQLHSGSGYWPFNSRHA